jgi:hypothetical protein
MSSSKSKKNRKGNPSHIEIEDSKPKGDIQEEESENREVQEMKTEDSNDDTDAGKTVKRLQIRVCSSKRGKYLRVKN